MICSLVKTQQQFEKHGCDNCDEYIEMAGDRTKIADCTTPSFEGYVSCRRWEVGGGRWEVGGGRWEVGGGRWEVGGERQEHKQLTLYTV